MKIGKSWRVRPEALEEFVRRSERPVTLEGELGSFLRVPDNILAVAQNHELLHRLDAAFLKAADARDGVLIKFYSAGSADRDEVRGRLKDGGLDVERLQKEGRLYVEAEHGSPEVRVEVLRRFLSREVEPGLTPWITFDWAGHVDPEETLRQQKALTGEIDSGQLVVETALLEEVTEGWSPTIQRRMQAAHSGTVWLSEDGLALSRVRRLSGLGGADARM